MIAVFGSIFFTIVKRLLTAHCVVPPIVLTVLRNHLILGLIHNCECGTLMCPLGKMELRLGTLIVIVTVKFPLNEWYMNFCLLALVFSLACPFTFPKALEIDAYRDTCTQLTQVFFLGGGLFRTWKEYSKMWFTEHILTSQTVFECSFFNYYVNVSNDFWLTCGQICFWKCQIRQFTIATKDAVISLSLSLHLHPPSSWLAIWVTGQGDVRSWSSLTFLGI